MKEISPSLYFILCNIKRNLDLQKENKYFKLLLLEECSITGFAKTVLQRDLYTRISREVKPIATRCR